MTPFHLYRVLVGEIIDDVGEKAKALVYDKAIEILRDRVKASQGKADSTLYGGFWFEATREDLNAAIAGLRAMTPPTVTIEIGRAAWGNGHLVLMPEECWLVGKQFAFLIGMTMSQMEYDVRRHDRVQKWKAFMTSEGKSLIPYGTGNDVANASSATAAMKSLRRMVETKLGVEFE